MNKRPKKFTLSAEEVMTIIAVFSTLMEINYDKLNIYLGSVTIKRMEALHDRLNAYYHNELAGRYDTARGWYDEED